MIGKHKNGNQQTLSPHVITSAAWKVLRDARLAFTDFKLVVKRNDSARSRIYWILCVTLLRAVGHVLQNKDSGRSEWLKISIDAHYKEIQARRLTDLIYWEFIVEERNILLKEYTASVFEKENGEIKLTNLIVGGIFYGPAEVIEASLSWWAQSLENIQAQANMRRLRDKNKPNS